jgi:small-conductance mechanosensitive channel
MVSFGVYFLALLFIFWMLGILPAIYTLLTAAGFIGIVVGFGLKEVLSNFVSGLIIAVEQPFKIDDEVEVKGFEGFVEDISIRMTTIKLWDGRVVYIPNSIMLTEPVINLRRSGRRQVEAEVVLDGRADFNRTIEVIKEVFGKEKLVLGKPEPFVIVDRIAPNEIKLKLRFWFDVSKTDYQTIKSSVMEAVKRNLA